MLVHLLGMSAAASSGSHPVAEATPEAKVIPAARRMLDLDLARPPL